MNKEEQPKVWTGNEDPPHPIFAESAEKLRLAKITVTEGGFYLMHKSTAHALFWGLLMGLMAGFSAEIGMQFVSFAMYGGAMFVAFRPYTIHKGNITMWTKIYQGLGIALVAVWFWRYAGFAL